VLYREPMWLKPSAGSGWCAPAIVSVLYREPMWLKPRRCAWSSEATSVSVLYREPMWLKHRPRPAGAAGARKRFSALP